MCMRSSAKYLLISAVCLVELTHTAENSVTVRSQIQSFCLPYSWCLYHSNISFRAVCCVGRVRTAVKRDMKRTRKWVGEDSQSRVYEKVAPWGLLSCLLTCVSLSSVLWLQASAAMSSRLRLCAYVGVRACWLSTLPDWCLGCLSPDPPGSLRGHSLHGPGVPADRSSWTQSPCLQLGPCLGGISCLWAQPLLHPGKVCQSSLHTYKT